MAVERPRQTEGGEDAPRQEPSPLVVDLGKHSRKRISRLRKGRGRLIKDVQRTIDELKRVKQIDEAAQPIVFIVRQKKRTRDCW
jgi:hypothetical protein